MQHGLSKGSLASAEVMKEINPASVREPSPQCGWKELKVNKGPLSGLLVAFLGIAAGLYLDHGQVGQMLQPTAALIVFGGTLARHGTVSIFRRRGGSPSVEDDLLA